MIKLAMRTDEEYARNSIETYLRNKLGFVGDIVEGEDPPDYYVLDGNNKIALEITTAESIFDGESQGNRKKTFTESVAIFCDELNIEFKNLIPANKSLMLVFKVPINDFSKFKKRLGPMLREFLQENDLSNRELNIHGEIVEVRWITYENSNHDAVIGAIGDKYPIINISEQTKLIIEKIIIEKET